MTQVICEEVLGIIDMAKQRQLSEDHCQTLFIVSSTKLRFDQMLCRKIEAFFG